MNELRDLLETPEQVRTEFAAFMDVPYGHYMCGNCYYDVTD
jgi:hypothetical protein